MAGATHQPRPPHLPGEPPPPVEPGQLRLAHELDTPHARHPRMPDDGVHQHRAEPRSARGGRDDHVEHDREVHPVRAHPPEPEHAPGSPAPPTPAPASSRNPSPAPPPAAHHADPNSSSRPGSRSGPTESHTSTSATSMPPRSQDYSWNLATRVCSSLLMAASSLAACLHCWTPAVVVSVVRATPSMLAAMSRLPLAASATLRFISPVVAVCSSTAAA